MRVLSNFFFFACMFAVWGLSSCSNSGNSDRDLSRIPYQSGGKWGYIDRKGKIHINPQFQEANVFSEGLALVQSSNDQYGFINKEGKYVINAQYKSATCFSEGLACVVAVNGRPQFIDTKGNVKFTVNPGDECGVFREGMCAVRVGEKWGYMDRSGEMKITPQFYAATPFHEGFAAIATKADKDSEVLWGFVDKNGQIVINCQFQLSGNLTLFSEGLAAVSDGDNSGYINLKGEYEINPQFKAATAFSEGYAAILQGRDAGYIDKKGQIVINPQFSEASNFHGSLAAVEDSGDKCGYIDKKGNYVINPQFDRATQFYDDIAFVRQGGKWGIIDKKGKYLVNPQFKDIVVEFDEWRYETVESDYLDVEALIQYISDGTDNSHFRKLSATTKLSELGDMFPELSIDFGNDEAIVEGMTQLNEYFSIGDWKFTFSESLSIGRPKPIYRTEEHEDYWGGGTYTTEVFDHYEYQPNHDATLSGIYFELKLTDSKSMAKSGEIFQQIREKWLEKASLNPGRSSYVFDNDALSLVIGGSGMSSGSYANYKIKFKNEEY